MKFYSLVFSIFIVFSSFTLSEKPSSKRDLKTNNKAALIIEKIHSSTPNQIEIDHLSQKEIVWLIDTLFELDSVPMDFIVTLSNYLELRKPTKFFSPFPANDFYQSWVDDKPNPYGNSIYDNDTTFKVCLTDSSFHCGYKHPFEGVVTSVYGWRDGKAHRGIDIDLVTGDSVASCFSGMVRFVGYYGGYGKVIVIRHYNGLETTYAHLSKTLVKSGEVVDPGTVIGLGGNTGRSTGSHLHFEVRFKGKDINPQNIINFKNFHLLSENITIKPTKYGYTAFPEGKEFHTVKRGDYLYKIAELYGTTVSNLCDWNGIRRNSSLRVGQKIRIEPI